jgi:hypothetical protein
MIKRRKGIKEDPSKTKKVRSKSKPHALWPDSDAKQQMSDEAAERDNLGKHSKKCGLDKEVVAGQQHER